MGKYEIVDSSVKGHKYIRFDSIKSFYYYTRGKRHKSLVDDLKTNIKYTGATEPDSWEQSLPDLAKLLYKPVQYHKEVLADAEKHKKTAEKLFADVIKCSNKQLKKKTYYEEYTQNHLQNLINSSLNSTLSEYKNRIITDEAAALSLDPNVEVFLEYPLKGNGSHPKRCDVILHKKAQRGKDKYIIIELKRYTGDFHPDDKPWEQIQDYIEAFNKALDVNAIGLVYIHKQMYYGSELFEEMGIALTAKGVMYTRGRCMKFVKKIMRNLS